MKRSPLLKPAWVSLLVLAITTAGCSEPAAHVREADSPPDAGPLRLESTSLSRRIESSTFRVRNLSCRGVSSGSGFAISGDSIVTNRHVAEGAEWIELNTWTGDSLSATVEGVSAVDDLAVITVTKPLPGRARLASQLPEIGDKLMTAGFPGGRAYLLSSGTFLGEGKGPYNGVRLTFEDARVEHGNSGGPVMNLAGEVVGVLTEGDEGSATRYAIPVRTLRKALASPRVAPSGC